MPDGPPYISKIVEDSIPGPVGINPGPNDCYHIIFDENRLWNVSCQWSLDTTQGNNNEIDIAFYKPAMFGKEFVGRFNNVHPDELGPWTKIKFDNEDIYVQGTFKHSPDPNQGFITCGLVSEQVSETGEQGTMTFGGDQASIATITIALVP